MEIDLYQLLADNWLMFTFFVIGSGYLLGKIKIGSIELGSITGVLFAGMLFGHFGFPDYSEAAEFGFALFIFSVGLQAGPSFFSAFLLDGSKYIALSMVVAATAVMLTLFLAGLFDFDYGLSAGLLGGALTSTPTLAGAQDAINSGLAVLPEGMTAQQASSNVSIGYAITYIFGVMGLTLLIRYFPVILRIDLAAEAKKLAKERGLLKRGGISAQAEALPIIRAYQVTAESIGKTIEQRWLELGKRGRALKVRRSGQLLQPDPELELQEGDVVSIVASLRDHETIQERVGREVLDPELLNYQIVFREIVVTDPHVVAGPLKELGITEGYGCYATGLTRASIDLPMSGNLILNKGDRLQVIGEESRLRKLAERVGYVEEELEETDLLTFCFGIVTGVLLGLFLFKIGSLSVGLGSAGGLLLSGILIGYLSSMRPTFGRVPTAARFILMEFGLVLFMSQVGLKAGGGVVQALLSVGPAIIVCGMLVTITPVVMGYLFGRYILRLNPALLLGSLTGAMTSTPSLNIVTTAAKSAVPALGYAGTYTFANVLLTFSGTVIMTL